MESNLTEKTQVGKIATKKVYTVPTLIMYGNLADLTATGTGTQAETSGAGGQVATKRS